MIQSRAAALAILAKLLLFFEALRLKAYQDCVGVWTIGVGETQGVRKGMVWTRDYALLRLNIRALEFLNAVLDACPQLVKEPPLRWAACGSLAYNIGKAGFRASSVCRLTKSREYARAAQCFMLWNKAGGKVNKGLTFRRGRESEYYLLQRKA